MPTILSDKPTTKIVISNNEITGYKKSSEHIQYYLLNGTEFALKLTNPKSNIRLKAKICIDGKYIGSDIVLDKKETTTIERFIETSKKFKFESYTVDKNPTVESIIRNNGKIAIEWYKEIIPTFNPNDYDIYKKYNDMFLYDPKHAPFYDPSRAPVITCNTNTEYFWRNVSGSSYTNGLSTDALYNKSTAHSITTGIISQGSDSNQTFDGEGDAEFDSVYFYREWIDLLDASLKSDHVPGKAKVYHETKVYCGKCGRRMKDKNWTFCPGCGNKF